MNAPREPRSLELERWLSGELDSEARARFEREWPRDVLDAAAAGDSALRERLLRELPAGVLRARVEQQLAAKKVRWLWVALPLAALAALVLLRVPRPARAPDSPELPAATERAKGLSPRLFVHRRRGGSTELLRDGAPGRAGDLLQLGYVSAAHGYGAIVSIDGSGGVTLHFPSSEESASALDPGSGEHLLPTSFELDAAPGFERFVFVSAKQPVAAREVVAAARALAAQPSRAQVAPLELPAAYHQAGFLLRKDP